MKHLFALIALTLLLVTPLALAADEPVKLLVSEFTYDKAPYPSCHASTVIETEHGQIVAAWFGGTAERAPDVCIWVSRRVDGKWTEGVAVGNGIQPPDADGKPVRLPTWNPVLFQPKGGPLMLFYKVGPAPRAWWGMVSTSTDDGKTWSKPTRLPDKILGPVKDKAIQLDDGTIVSPSSTEDNGRQVHFELSKDMGRTWDLVGPVADPLKLGAIQPTILRHPGGKLQALVRSDKPSAVIGETWSSDGGRTWSELAKTKLPNPDSGIDALTLADGRFVLVYNPSAPGVRTPLVVAVSKDGKDWKDVLTLESEPMKQFSYPAIIQSREGLLHITYTYLRQHIKYVVIDPKSF